MLWSHDFGNNRQSGFASGSGQHLQPQLFVALKAIGAGPGLERPAPQAGRAQFLELAGQGHDLLFALDRARAGNNRNFDAADLEAPYLDGSPFAREFRGSTLVRGHDRQDLLHAVTRLEYLGEPHPFLAERRNDGLMLASNHLGCQPQGRDALGHVINLIGCRIYFHHHDHGRSPSPKVNQVLRSGPALN